MDGCDENARGAMKPASFQGHSMEGGKFIAEAGKNRRALRDIKNFVGAPPYPRAISKRGLTEKNVVDCKNPALAAHKPMTRNFTASQKSQLCSQASDIGCERHKNVSNLKVFDSSTAIDVEDYKSDNPLLLGEEMEVVGNSELREVEMEDLVADPIASCDIDIDSSDSNNPLAAVDYVEDIYSYYRRVEDEGCVCPNYMSSQFDINEKMRAILIDWLIEVHYKFELMDETLYLTVNIIDRFLAHQTVVRKKLQLVGVTAMLLACKYEEVSVPVVEDLILISDRAYTREEVLEMEKLMVNTLQFNMSVPTPYPFIRRFLKAAQADKKLELLSSFMVELCLVQYDMLKFRPSLMAASAIYTAQCTLKGFRHWSRTSELHTLYAEDQLLECSRMMVEFHQHAGMGKLTGVHRKYSTFKFGCAAKSEPALFLLEMRL